MPSDRLDREGEAVSLHYLGVTRGRDKMSIDPPLEVLPRHIPKEIRDRGMRINKDLRAPPVYVEALPPVEDVRVGEDKASLPGILRLFPSARGHSANVSIRFKLMIECKKVFIHKRRGDSGE